MESSKNECAQLVAYFREQGEFKGDIEEIKMIDQFLSRHRDGNFPSDLPNLIKILQDIAKTDSSQLQYKPLQLLRFCTKPPEYRSYLSP